MSSEKTLLQAALSHLDLALLNICEQVQHYQLKADDKDFLSEALTKLQQLPLHKESEAEPPSQGQIWKGGFSLSNIDIKEEVHSETQLLDGRKLEVEKNEKLVPQGSIVDQKVSSAQSLSCKSYNCETTSRSVVMSASEINLEMADLLKIMVDAYVDFDKDGLGVEQAKLQSLSINLGLRQVHCEAVFSQVEKTHDGLIYQEEWKSIAKDILAKHTHKEIIGIIKIARRNKLQGKSVHSVFKPKWHVRRRCILSFKSRTRCAWDLLMTALLCYVALALPLTISLEHVTLLETIDLVVDWIFFLDLLLNFRTTFVDYHKEEIWDPCLIARYYLKTWFLLDFVSSVPFGQLTSGTLPRMQSAKLLKFGRIAKVTKMLRFGKTCKSWASSDIVDKCEEFIWAHHLLSVSRGIILLLQVLVAGHWLACLLLACGGDSAEEYMGNMGTDDGDELQKYMVALYWAMMTMTTVGYGDVPMRTDLERMYAIVAMIIGGGFYGYVIGVVTTVLTRHDLNQRAFTERMDIVVSWLNNHYELHPGLRRRVWKHFKEFLTTTKAIEDSIILNDLPPSLCNDVSAALLPDSARHNPLFANLSSRALSRIVRSISEIKFQSNEVVVDKGDAGKAMFIIDRGFAHMEVSGENVRYLCAGDSFGEEVLLNDVTEYAYSVRTHSKVRMFRLIRDDFLANFSDLHHDLTTMVDNFYVMTNVAQDTYKKMRKKVHDTMPGVSSLIAGGPQGIAASFPDVVLANFNELVESVDAIQQGLKQGTLQNDRAQASERESVVTFEI